MKNRGRMLLLAVLVAGISGMGTHMPAFATQSEIDAVNDKIDQLEEEREKSSQELENLEDEKAYLEGELLELDNKLSVLADELTGLQEQLQEKEAEILLTTQQLEQARQEEETQYENMKKRIRFLYERGNTSILEVMLQADGFADFLNLSEYVESVQKYDREMLEKYRIIKEEIAAKEARLTEEQETLLALTEDKQTKQQEVEKLLAEVEDKIDINGSRMDNLESAIADYDAELEEQKAYEEKLEAQKAQEDAKRLEEIKRQEAENTAQPVVSDSKSDLALLAALIECEAGGESYEGKLAVGSVVMNRVRSSYFPNTVVEVIYQKGQFTPVASGRFAVVLSRGANSSCVQAAQETLAGNITVGCLYFRRNRGTIEGIIIGNHVFY